MADDLRLLLDEHYPGWLAERLDEAGVDCAAVVLRSELRGVGDTSLLRRATSEGRAVVTEDVTTFSMAIAAVPDHAGVVFCHHRRFPRTRPGLVRLGDALLALATAPPPTVSHPPFIWWLSAR